MKKLLLPLMNILFISIVQAQVNHPSVKIGNQTWMVKNLDVDHYRNGDPIPEVTISDEWSELTTGAWCYKYIENDSAMGAIYGKLYNWYAVNDPRGLAPTGWHIPSEEEWKRLETALGGDSVAGGKMKEAGILHWLSPNEAASNSSGWTGLPGGSRYSGGAEFSDNKSLGYWWSATEFNTSNAWARYLYWGDGIIRKHNYDKRQGFSVRCIKD